jgi:hypothetical protein
MFDKKKEHYLEENSNSPPPALFTEELNAEDISQRKPPREKGKLKVTRNRVADRSSNTKRKTSVQHQFFPFRMWIIMRVFYE